MQKINRSKNYKKLKKTIVRSSKSLRKHWAMSFIICLLTLSLMSSLVQAVGIGAPISLTPDPQNIIEETPYQSAFFNINSSEVSEFTTGCRIETFGGQTSLLTQLNKMISGIDYPEWKLRRIYLGLDNEALEQYCDEDTVDKISDTLGYKKIESIDEIDEAMAVLSPGGLSSTINSSSIKILSERPGSGILYAEEQVYALTNLGKVNAQDDINVYYPGTGFSLLRPVQDLWGWSVNVVYGFLVLLIIIVSFLVVFKDYLSGSLSITAQSAIPNIAIAMILVPLSYAISGLAIDAVTLGTNVVHGFLMGPGSPARIVYENSDDTLGPLGGSDRGYYADDARMTWYYSFSNANVSDQVSDLGDMPILTNNVIFQFIDRVVQFATLGILDGKTIQDAILGFVGTVISLGVGILMFLTGLRIAWRLLKKFLVFIVVPIFSPFVFATMAIPGTGTKNIIMYLKILFSASLFYITAYAMILLNVVLSSTAFQQDIGISLQDRSLYSPPVLGLPLIDWGDTSDATPFLFTLLALIIYLAIPRTLDGIDKSMGTDKSLLAPLISNTIESAKQSVNVGKTLASAPGSIAGGIDKVTGGAIKDRAVRSSARLNKAFDNLAGSNNFLSRAVGKTYQQTAGRALQSSNYMKGVADPSKPSSIKAEISWNGQPAGGGFIAFTKKMVRYYGLEAGVSAAIPIPGASLDITADNLTLPRRLTDGLISVFDVDGKNPNSANESKNNLLNSNWSGRSITLRAGQVLWSTPKGSIQVVVGADIEDYFRSDDSRTKISIPLEVRVNNIKAAFGFDYGQYMLKKDFDMVNGEVTMSNAFRGSKYILRFNGVDSNPFRFGIQLSAGND